MGNKIIECKNITKTFNVTSSFASSSKMTVKALDNVDFFANDSEIVGIVGESGSGKTTLAKILCGIYEPDNGSIFYKGENIKSEKEKFLVYRKNVQMVFQDPYSSLNPRLKIISTLKDGIKKHITKDKEKIYKISNDLLKVVGLETEHLFRYPHQFSGGQRQRLSIARALSVDPEIIVADEPVSALDVSVQANILNLFKKLNKDKKKTIILISHDLSVVKFLCNRVYVMYKGIIVEEGLISEVLSNPYHPYTKQLISSKNLELMEKNNNVQSSPCPFAPRCIKYKEEICNQPLSHKQISKTHFVKCSIL